MVRASREGNWELHLSCVCQMLPWYFSYDVIDYARYMSAYYSNMTCLPDEQPEVHAFMKNGGFSVQLSNDNTFGRIQVDQALEEIVNKNIQTPEGALVWNLEPYKDNNWRQNSELCSCTVCAKWLAIPIKREARPYWASLVSHCPRWQRCCCNGWFNQGLDRSICRSYAAVQHLNRSCCHYYYSRGLCDRL